MHLETGQADDELEQRRQADQVPGHFQDGQGLSRTRARVDPRTDTLKEKNKEFEGVNLEQALRLQLELRGEIREAAERAVSRTRYGDYVTLLLQSKTARGEL